jgi:thioredoxin reductase
VATGIKDQVPPIAGIEPLYGSSVFQCAYCDGWEVRDSPIAAYGARAAMFVHSGHQRRSSLAESLGCVVEGDELVDTHDRQATCIPGVYVAGDAARDVKFAIVAAGLGSNGDVSCSSDWTLASWIWPEASLPGRRP